MTACFFQHQRHRLTLHTFNLIYSQCKTILGNLHHDLTSTMLQPIETSQSIIQPPPSSHTPSVPAPGVKSETQPHQSPACPTPATFVEEAARYADPLPGVTTRMKAAAQNLTRIQLDYLLRLLQQMNTYKAQQKYGDLRASSGSSDTFQIRRSLLANPPTL